MVGHDIGIAGCGVAGLAAAVLLHRQGHTVTLYDRFERPRPLGSGLMIQPTGLAVLEQLGLAREILYRGAPIARLFGLNERGKVVLDARYSDLATPGAFGIGVHRTSLFAALLDAVAAEGIAVRCGKEIVSSSLTARGRNFTFTDGDSSPPHELAVDALGLHSPLVPRNGGWLAYGALWASLDWPKNGPFDWTCLEQRYRSARQMVGVIPIGRRSATAVPEVAFFWSLRADRLDEWRRVGLARWKDDVLALWPDCEGVLEQITDPEQLTFARYAHRTLARPHGERIVHIGDAWHATSPQLGQGANMALLDAHALAAGLGQSGTLSERLAHAIALRRAHVRLYQWLTAVFTPLYQSDSNLAALLRDHVLAPVSRFGPTARIQSLLVSGLVGWPMQRLGLDIPDYLALADGTAVASETVPLP